MQKNRNGALTPKPQKAEINNWEMDLVQQLLVVVGQQSLNPQVNEKILWKNSADGLFSAKSSYRCLEGVSQTSAPVKLLWNPLQPTRLWFLLGK